jgi:N-acetyl sugar amidotransferase
MNLQICSRCIIDSTVAGVWFDSVGECNHCKMHDELDRAYPLNDKGREDFERLIDTIRRNGRDKPYDCIVGISGGRDSIYTIYLLKNLGLRPLAVHFNDGFGNPVAGENMTRATQKLSIDMRTITSDWRESKDLRIAFLKASTPDFGMPTDLGIAAALYGVATKEKIGCVMIGQSFRTEGVCPLEWLYFEGKYLKQVHRIFGTVPLRSWKPEDPGFNLGLKEFCYYAFIKRIKTILPLYYVDYNRSEVDQILSSELGWVNTGAHYYDDLYQSLMTYILRVKFGIDRRLFNYAALVRSGQMLRQEAIERTSEIYSIEDPKVIQLCIKRLGLKTEEFNEIMAREPKTFKDYRTNYNFLVKMKYLIKMTTYLHIVPKSTYMKYFELN